MQYSVTNQVIADILAGKYVTGTYKFNEDELVKKVRDL